MKNKGDFQLERISMKTVYQQLCPVLFGAGSLNDIGDMAKKFSASKAFIVCDQGVKRTGVIDRILSLLANEEIKASVYDGVLPDAPANMVNEAGLFANDFGADLIIGIGGGSSLDTAKAVVVLRDNPPPISLYYLSNKGKHEKKTPLILIPTAAGTGSEVTIMSVIHDYDTDAKEAVFRAADYAIVDPELTVTAPKSVTAATALDALSHAIEAYTSLTHNPKSDVLALEAIKLIMENLETAYANGEDIRARTNLSLASNLAGMAFNDAGVHFGHAVAHEFGIQFHLPHGVACALTLPEVIRVTAEVMPDRGKKIADILGYTQDCKIDASKYVINEIISLMKKMEIKSLRDQNISVEQAKKCAKGAVEKNGFIVASPIEVTVDTMERIIEKMYIAY